MTSAPANLSRCKLIEGRINQAIKVGNTWALVVAQLVERSPPTPEIRGSNSFICKLLYLFTVDSVEKTKIKKKEAGNGPFFKKRLTLPILNKAI